MVLPTALQQRHAGRSQEDAMIVEDVPLQILTLDATQLVKVGRKGSLTRRLSHTIKARAS